MISFVQQAGDAEQHTVKALFRQMRRRGAQLTNPVVRRVRRVGMKRPLVLAGGAHGGQGEAGFFNAELDREKMSLRTIESQHPAWTSGFRGFGVQSSVPTGGFGVDLFE